MKLKEIKNLNVKEVDEELFRELIQWEKKDLVEQVLSQMDTENKRDWIKSYFED